MVESGLVEERYTRAHIGFNDPKQDRTPKPRCSRYSNKEKTAKTPPTPPAKKETKKKSSSMMDFWRTIEMVWERISR